MAEAQVIGAIAIRVEADAEGLYSEFRHIKAVAQAFENTVKITIPFKIDSASEFARVKSEMARIQQMAGSIGGRMGQAVGGSSYAVPAGAPSYTVDGRGMLVGPGGLTGGGGRFSAISGGSYVAGNGGRFSGDAFASQSASAVRVAPGNFGTQVTLPIAGGEEGEEGATGGRSGGSGFFRDFRRTAAIGLAAYAPLAGYGAYMDRQRDLSTARTYGEKAQAELNFQGNVASAVPILGSVAGMAANAIGSAFGASSQQSQATLAQAQQYDQFVGIQREAQEAHTGMTAKIHEATAGFDAMTKAEAEIASNLSKAKDATADYYKAAIEAAGDDKSQADYLRGKQKEANDDADKLAKAQKDAIAVHLGDRYAVASSRLATSGAIDNPLARMREGLAASQLEISRVSALPSTPENQAIIRTYTRERQANQRAYDEAVANQNFDLATGTQVDRMRLAAGPFDTIATARANRFGQARRLQNDVSRADVSVRSAVLANGQAGLALTDQQIAATIGVSKYDLATRQQSASFAATAGNSASPEFIAQYSTAIAQGRNLAKEVALAPSETREAVRAADIATLQAQRADLTRVGSRTYAESFDGGFQSTDALKSAGGDAVGELKKISDLIGQQIDYLKKISDSKAVIGS